ncbi:BamA/TamA family outer membrane protein [Labilibaculum antarcticum]|uniref:Bacterial surface antigen (D15) domain-containing protein n=1 Tax=Labilibaculum antarcticum TaxID=1717717 RepID=A0A1Y1CLZ8_9BACT|nr:hypothetical protein [Labilibaculum antarcticum]BAX81375.1 hypothetical protein ALGA_3075 [Labilibaculum antarcticum]
MILFLLIGNLLHANGQRISRRDTLIEKLQYSQLQDSTFIISRDTLIFLLDTVNESSLESNSNNGSKFYNSLKRGAGKRKFTKELYNLFFVSPDKLNPTDTIKTERSEVAFLQYQGKTIRNISIRVLEPFGPTLYDTTQIAHTWLETTGNKLHNTSRRNHLRKLLRLSEGDAVDPYNLADNERLIRELSYVKDAYFRVIPVLGSQTLVDLQLWVKDQFSWGANMKVGSLSSTEFEIYSRNLYGLGHEFSNSFEFDSDKDQKYGYTGRYKIRNIRKSYIDATFTYQNTYEKAVVQVDLDRSFATYNTKYAGGFTLSQTMRSDEIQKDDPIINEIPLDFNYGNIWFGRSYKIKSRNKFARRKLYITGRISGREFFERPEVGPALNQSFHNNIHYLTSISLSQIQYYKSNLIYNFGRTEDIPYGSLAQLTMGYEDREYSHRRYLGFDFQKAAYLSKSRTYFFNRVALGGYFNSQKFEQGVLLGQTKFFSRIRNLGPLRLRNFADLQYTLGIRRFPDEFISLLTDTGIRGFSKEDVIGTQKLVLNLETVAFTPYTLGGFRFAFYTFADMGFIGSNKKNILKEKFYYGVGFGIRLNNENLVFKTIQLRLAFYPKAPSDFNRFEYRISGEERPKFNNFRVTQPEVVPFE